VFLPFSRDTPFLHAPHDKEPWAFVLFPPLGGFSLLVPNRDSQVSLRAVTHNGLVDFLLSGNAGPFPRELLLFDSLNTLSFSARGSAFSKTITNDNSARHYSGYCQGDF